MPNPRTAQRLRDLILNATEIKSLTNWSDKMTESYLTIIENFVIISDLLDIEIDKKIEETPTSFLNGSIPFAENSFLIEDNANLYWDYLNKKLGIGTATPSANLDVNPDSINTSTFSRPFPVLTNVQRESLINMPPGAGIYNSDSKVIDIYTSSDWRAQRQKKIVYINDISDFPAPVAGKIILEPYTTYLGDQSVRYSFSDVIEFNFASTFQSIDINTSAGIIIADGANLNIFGCDLRYTGTGTFITGTNITSASYIQRARILSLGGGVVFDLNTSIPDTTLICQSIAFAGGGGTISNIIFSLTDCVYAYMTSSLNILDGKLTKINGLNISGINLPITFLNISGTVQLPIIIDNYSPLLQPNEYGIYFDPTTIYNTVTVKGSVAFGVIDNMIAPGSYDQTSLGFKFVGNVNIPDSTANIGLTLSNNLINTTFSAVNTPTLVAGTWLIGDYERFNGTVTGRMTYIGLEKMIAQILANPTAVTGSGTNKDVSFYFVHGNEIEHAITAFADAGGGQVTVTSAAHGLANGDRVAIKNTTNYNGTYTISNVTTDTFEITAIWVTTETGDWAKILEVSKASNQLGSTTKASNTSVQFLYKFITNDYFELFIENNTDANPLRVINCALTIIKA